MVDKVSLLSLPQPQQGVPFKPEVAERYDQMEGIQRRVERHIPKGVEPPRALNTRIVAPRAPIPEDIKKDVIRVVDRICEITNHKPISRRILDITNRVAAATETFVFRKKEREYEKKEKTAENVEQQKSWKNWQATSYLGGGFGSAFLAIVGASLNNSIGELLTGLSRLSTPAAESLVKYMDAPLTGLSHEQQFFLNTVQSDKQAVEGLKNLPKELSQLVMELIRLEGRAIESIAQGR